MENLQANNEIRKLKTAAGLRPFETRLGNVTLVKRGEYVACCPFHSDTNPSLAISEKDGEYVWFCRSQCDEGGDVLDFIMKKDHVEFPEARKQLAKSAGIVLEKDETAFEYYLEKAGARLAEAEEYLTTRGISLEVAEARGVGVVDHPSLGPSLAIPYDPTVQHDGLVKFRKLPPITDSKKKFRHSFGHSSDTTLYGIEQLDNWDFGVDAELFIVESELDALTMATHGFYAVSVGSASTVINSDKKLKIEPEILHRIGDCERVYLALDMDEPGQKCADAFERELPAVKTFRLMWPYTKGTSGEKDIGEIYQKDPDDFKAHIDRLCQAAVNRPPSWRGFFKSVDQMERGDIRFLIRGFLPEGVTFLGGLSGCGKSWIALSMAKALTTGTKFLDYFEVPEPTNVLYLSPEVGERSFRSRLEKLGIHDRFLCRTMRDGPLDLDNGKLLDAVRSLRPVVFLDTIVRFNKAENENAANENAQGLATAVALLLTNGAQAVVGLHHSTKASANENIMTLENVLRGTGDLGAMCDAVYGLRSLNPGDVTIQLQCVKPKDFDPLPPFTVQGRPCIDDTGDLKLVTQPGQSPEDVDLDVLDKAIRANPKADFRELSTKLGMSKNRLGKLATKAGWKKERGLSWERLDGTVTPELLLNSGPAGVIH